MPMDKVTKYWKAITQIEAQDALTAINVSSYPSMKKHAMKKYRNLLMKQSGLLAEKSPVSMQQFMSGFQGLSNG